MDASMNYLLDTDAFIWWAYTPELLPPDVVAACVNRSNTIVITVATVWEINAKMAAERRRLKKNATYLSQLPEVGTDADFLRMLKAQQAQGVVVRNVTLRIVKRMIAMPWHHTDTFDRIVIATALHERLRLISSDTEFPPYQADGLDLWQIPKP